MADSVSLEEFLNGNASLAGNHNTKKVHFKYPNPDSDMKMVDGLSPMPKLFWKEMLLGEGLHDQREGKSINISNEDEEFDLLDGDIRKSTVDEISLIDFLDRVNKILIKHI
ncbi:cysteine-rich receptor-like protein kinase 1 [Gossypium australe]|uniref:Cysteine-rich receptor-like protein kinase 1 n=1 Tax=Gossypium australe TaxID=47621 RepID=A0A5B6WD43_9ROSI|nr:cysteine-rich receptor-like protein kinase 1 [Gossypium australe]